MTWALTLDFTNHLGKFVTHYLPVFRSETECQLTADLIMRVLFDSEVTTVIAFTCNLA